MWKTDDSAGPQGRTRYRAHLRKPTCGYAAIPYSARRLSQATLVAKAYHQGKVVGLIGHAGPVGNSAGVVDGKRATVSLASRTTWSTRAPPGWTAGLPRRQL